MWKYAHLYLKLDSKVPFYHNFWVYPLFSFGAILSFISFILSPFIYSMHKLISRLQKSKNKFIKRTADAIGFTMGIPLVFCFMSTTLIRRINDRYSKQENNKKG